MVQNTKHWPATYTLTSFDGYEAPSGFSMEICFKNSVTTQIATTWYIKDELEGL
jgi:hypothetical protein